MKHTLKNYTKLFATTAIAFCLLAPAAYVDDAGKIKALEKQLAQAMKMIEAQSAQMNNLQVQVKKIGKIRSPRSSVAVNREIEERLAAVEDVAYDLDDRAGSQTIVNAFDASNFDIGGFVNTAYTFADGEDGSAGAFNRQNFEILIRADLSAQWSAFFAGGFLRESDVNLTDAEGRRNPDFTIINKNPQIIGWVNYKHTDALNVKLGRMITPHGIINIEHFPATLLDQEQPQFLRPFSGDTIFPNFTTGVQAHGTFFNNDDTIVYNTYAATKQGAPEKMLFGGRLGYNFGKYGVSVGVNGLVGARNETAGLDSDYSMVGADLLIDKGQVLWKTEVYSTSEEDGDDRVAFYTQPAWRINDKWTAFYRYDYLDSGLAVNATDDGRSVENVVGINFLPLPNVRMRLTATNREYKSGASGNADLDIYQFSTTFSF